MHGTVGCDERRETDDVTISDNGYIEGCQDPANSQRIY
jgi:hypothetical protein